MLQFTSGTRTNTLGYVLNTLAALGLPASLKKGVRSDKVTWLGFSVVEKDVLEWSIPAEFLDELKGMLGKWDSSSHAATKELRQVAGTCAWLGSVFSRMRWTTSVFYAVLSQTMQEGEQATSSADTGTKKGLFAVKELERARLWLLHFIEAAKLRTKRRIKLREGSLTTVQLSTNASPEALAIGGKIILAYFSAVDKSHTDELLVEQDTPGSQAVMEALATLVA